MEWELGDACALTNSIAATQPAWYLHSICNFFSSLDSYNVDPLVLCASPSAAIFGIEGVRMCEWEHQNN